MWLEFKNAIKEIWHLEILGDKMSHHVQKFQTRGIPGRNFTKETGMCMRIQEFSRYEFFEFQKRNRPYALEN